MGILCIVLEGGEAIGCKDMIFLSSRVGGVGAFEEEVTVPMDDCVRWRISYAPLVVKLLTVNIFIPTVA